MSQFSPNTKNNEYYPTVFLPVPIHKTGGMETRILATSRICRELNIKPIYFGLSCETNNNTNVISSLLPVENRELFYFKPSDFRGFARVVNERKPIAVISFNSRLAQAAYPYLNPTVLRVSAVNAIHYAGFYNTLFMLSHADVLLYETETQRQQWSGICNRLGVNLVADAYYFEPPPKYNPKKDRPLEPIRIVYLGRLEEKTKKISFISRLHSTLKASGLDFDMTIAGDGPDAELLMPILDQPEVKIHKYVYGNEKQSILDKADILILPSYSEGFGMVIVEAALSNTVTISNKIPHLKSSFRDAVIQIDTGNIELWIEEITNLSNDRKKLEQMKSEASAYILNKFSNIEKSKSIYRNLFSMERSFPTLRQTVYRYALTMLEVFPKAVKWRFFKLFFRSLM